jgi:hypothetical protein
MWPLRIMLVLIALAAVAEGGVRLSRADDVPTYRLAPGVGYELAPGQRGAFLWTHDWAIDREGCGVAREFRPQGLVLIGDSVVFGGNPLAQRQRLGPQLEAILGRPVWPCAAGGWSLSNELAWLDRHPRTLRAPELVLLLNSADFSGPAGWQGQGVQPLHRPLAAALWLGRRLLTRPTADPPPSAQAWRPALDRLLDRYPGRVVFVLYPKRAELADRADPFAPLRPLLAARRLPAIEVRAAPQWGPGLYRDGTHPSARGTAVLAAVIARGLQPAETVITPALAHTRPTT